MVQLWSYTLQGVYEMNEGVYLKLLDDCLKTYNKKQQELKWKKHELKN